MDKINVVWYGNPERTEYRIWWDMALLSDILANKIIQTNQEFIHYDGIDILPEGEGAVVMLPSRLWADREDEINNNLQRLKYVVLICFGNEEGTFNFTKIRHPMLRVWMQLPRMNMHNDVSYKLVNGYRTTTIEQIKTTGLQERTIDYAFIGQVNHERRHQCVDVLNQFHGLYPTSVIIETDGFGKEVVAYPDYIDILSKTKIAPCPSGVECCDSFRLYEALEAGCLPVVDAFSTNFKTPGFWQYLFREEVPFPIVPYWDDFPQVLPVLLKEYPANANKCFAWWQLFKRSIAYKLIDDVRILHG